MRHHPTPTIALDHTSYQFTTRGKLKVLALFLLISGLLDYAQGNLGESAAFLRGAFLVLGSSCLLPAHWTAPVARGQNTIQL